MIHDPNAPQKLLIELQSVYRDADALFAGWSCPTSTRCCRFGVTGVEPYVTSIEWLAVRVAIERRSGPLQQVLRQVQAPTRSDRSPPPGREVRSERVCPMLSPAGRCEVYESRPLGCRTYYCSGANSGQRVTHKQVLQLVRSIEQIALRHEPGGDRPHRFGKMLGV
jgi:uncharacterized protein